MKETTTHAGSRAIAISLLAIVGLASGGRREPVAEQALAPVQVTAVEAYSGREGVAYAANIIPYSQVVLSFKSGGYVQSILQVKGADGRTRNVQNGDWVQQGAVLAQDAARVRTDWNQESSVVKLEIDPDG
ncbi:MAG: hypothetical protein ABSF46_07385 [Terriglobia bacterium]|jgi:multidrug efflux system membrane fusion protein